MAINVGTYAPDTPSAPNFQALAASDLARDRQFQMQERQRSIAQAAIDKRQKQTQAQAQIKQIAYDPHYMSGSQFDPFVKNKMIGLDASLQNWAAANPDKNVLEAQNDPTVMKSLNDVTMASQKAKGYVEWEKGFANSQSDGVDGKQLLPIVKYKLTHDKNGNELPLDQIDLSKADDIANDNVHMALKSDSLGKWYKDQGTSDIGSVKSTMDADGTKHLDNISMKLPTIAEYDPVTKQIQLRTTTRTNADGSKERIVAPDIFKQMIGDSRTKSHLLAAVTKLNEDKVAKGESPIDPTGAQAELVMRKEAVRILDPLIDQTRKENHAVMEPNQLMTAVRQQGLSNSRLSNQSTQLTIEEKKLALEGKNPDGSAKAQTGVWLNPAGQDLADIIKSTPAPPEKSSILGGFKKPGTVDLMALAKGGIIYKEKGVPYDTFVKDSDGNISATYKVKEPNPDAGIPGEPKNISVTKTEKWSASKFDEMMKQIGSANFIKGSNFPGATQSTPPKAQSAPVKKKLY